MGRSRLLLVAGLVAVEAPAGAHHSFAMFDRDHPIVIAGEITKFDWTNPHSWLYVTGGPSGASPKTWAVEMTSPNILVYKGWRPNTVKPGERITLTIYPLRDGSTGGAFLKAVTATGRVLTQEAPPAPAK